MCVYVCIAAAAVSPMHYVHLTAQVQTKIVLGDICTVLEDIKKNISAHIFLTSLFLYHKIHFLWHVTVL